MASVTLWTTFSPAQITDDLPVEDLHQNLPDEEK